MGVLVGEGVLAPTSLLTKDDNMGTKRVLMKIQENTLIVVNRGQSAVIMIFHMRN